MRTMKGTTASAIVAMVLVSTGVACSEQESARLLQVDAYPKEVSSSCRDGVAQIYDECSDQNTILGEARKSAAASGKSVLIVYGAEWCIWCHVFDKYVRGQSREFEYEYEYEGEPQYWPMREIENENAETEANQLNNYVSENFVIAYIEGHYSPNGPEILAEIGYNVDDLTFVPLYVVLNGEGKYAGHMQSVDLIEGLEVRADSGEEYRGYDREILLRELRQLRNVSIASAADSRPLAVTR